MNALTVNLHLLLASFYRPSGGRTKILMEAGAFPSDQYAAATQAKHHELDPATTIVTVAPREGERLRPRRSLVTARRVGAYALISDLEILKIAAWKPEDPLPLLFP